jgi:non-specific serine/threonine protein kinase
VELAAISEDALVAPLAASTLGVLEAAGSSPLESVVAFLRPRAVLLVLDNCEHLVEACAHLVDRLLASCPDLRILATSREPLRVDGERQRRVPPLAVPGPQDAHSPEALGRWPAVQLFVERARATEPEFRLAGENAPAVAEICASLDGIPLALELAAARVSVLSVGQIQERLSDSLQLLSGGGRAKPTRQKTLRAAFDWSYALLSALEQSAFRQLAVFRGGWSLEEAEAVVGFGEGTSPPPNRLAAREAAIPRPLIPDPWLPTPGPPVLDLLTGLVGKSLVVVDGGGRNARYRLLEPVRQYAQEHLDAVGGTAAARTRHLTCYLALAERAAAQLHGPEQVAWLDRLDLERDNLRVALRWTDEQGDRTSLLRLAGALALFWEGRSHIREGRQWLEAALQAADDATPPEIRLRALLGAGHMAHYEADYAASVARFEECLAIAQRVGDRSGMAAALTDLGMSLRLQGNLTRSREVLEEALLLYDALGDRSGRALALGNLGATIRPSGGWVGRAPAAASIPADPAAIALSAEATAQSLRHLEESLALYEGEGDVRMAAIIRHTLGLTYLQQGDLAAAGQSFATAFAEHTRVGDRWCMTYSLMGLAATLVRLGAGASAVRILASASALGDVPGDPLTNVGRATYGPLIEEVRAQVSVAEFARLWAEGRAMSFAEAVAAATAAAESDEAPATAAPSSRVGAAAVLLTPREREVATLIGQGCRTDREIAERLTITAGTASVHVHHILEKLAFHSRWQIADWAVAQGLH